MDDQAGRNLSSYYIQIPNFANVVTYPRSITAEPRQEQVPKLQLLCSRLQGLGIRESLRIYDQGTERISTTLSEI